MGEELFEGHNSLGDDSKPKPSPLRWDKVRAASDRGTMWDTCILFQVTKFEGAVKCRGIALGDSWSSLENFVIEHEAWKVLQFKPQIKKQILMHDSSKTRLLMTREKSDSRKAIMTSMLG
ncbi:hypothetical protein Tco_1421733, partial [Tanacetum coccineum]